MYPVGTQSGDIMETGDIMENTLAGAAGASGSEQPAVQNEKNVVATLTFVLLWIAVAIPMLWGIMKALDNVETLFL
jgi:hypothetical protein